MKLLKYFCSDRIKFDFYITITLMMLLCVYGDINCCLCNCAHWITKNFATCSGTGMVFMMVQHKIGKIFSNQRKAFYSLLYKIFTQLENIFIKFKHSVRKISGVFGWNAMPTLLSHIPSLFYHLKLLDQYHSLCGPYQLVTEGRHHCQRFKCLSINSAPMII